MRQNCSINLSGNKGKGIALDEFVESQMVGPLKQYYFRGTTVKTLKLISANLQLFSSARKAYLSKSGFDVHRTKAHSEADPLCDQVKVAWWALKEKLFLSDASRTRAKRYTYQGQSSSTDFVPANLIDIYNKGKEKLHESKKKRIYELFPEIRLKCKIV